MASARLPPVRLSEKDGEELVRRLAKLGQQDPLPPPVVPGIPGAKLPPPGRLELPPLHAKTSASTQVGLPAPPAPQSAPVPPAVGHGSEPPRSLSPPPVSVPTSEAEREAAKLRAQLQDALQEAARLREKQVQVEVEQSPIGAARRELVRRLKPWLIGVAMSAVGWGVSYVKGQAKGYLDAFERVSKLEGAFRVERDRRAKLDGEAAEAFANVNADLNTAFAKNREQDAKLQRLDELMKEAPVVVRPK
jgi:hypothetical protein